MANELADTEVDIIKEAQREEFKEEIIAPTARKELSKRSHLLPLTSMLDGGLLRSNTRLWRSDDLAADTHTAVKRKNPTPLPVFATSNFLRV